MQLKRLKNTAIRILRGPLRSADIRGPKWFLIDFFPWKLKFRFSTQPRSTWNLFSLIWRNFLAISFITAQYSVKKQKNLVAQKKRYFHEIFAKNVWDWISVIFTLSEKQEILFHQNFFVKSSTCTYNFFTKSVTFTKFLSKS